MKQYYKPHDNYCVERHRAALDLNFIYLGADHYELPETYGRKGIVVDLSATGNTQHQILKMVAQQLVHMLKEQPVAAMPDLDSQDFYNLMQVYRRTPDTNQEATIKAFESVKEWVRGETAEKALSNLAEYGIPGTENLGSVHWFRTIVSQAKHMGELIEKKSGTIQPETCKFYGSKIQSICKDLLAWQETGKPLFNAKFQNETDAAMPIRKVCFFKLKGDKYLTENGIEITTEMLVKYPHQVTDTWSFIVLD